MNSRPNSSAPSGSRATHLAAVMFGSMMLVAACSKGEGTAVTQAVAKVNKEEITELQVNQILERQRGLEGVQVEAASRRVVSSLVDQEIVLQKAKELKLDRDPRVVQGIEAARREIITRAYLDRVSDGAAAPSADEVSAYYEAKPALFKERRIYSLQEVAVDSPADKREQLETDLKALKSTAELETYLKDRKLRVRAERSTVAAENLPMALLDRLATVKPGAGLVVPAADGVRVVVVNAVQDAPATIEQARPAIETFLLNERKRQVVDKEVQSLRRSAAIEYFGKYKGMGASGPAASATTSSPGAVPPVAAQASGSTMDAATMSKGMSGLK